MTELKRAEVEKRFNKLVGDVFRLSSDKIAKLKPSTNFAMDLGARSMMIIALIAATESEFGIKTEPTETSKNQTIKQSVDYIMKLLKAKKV